MLWASWHFILLLDVGRSLPFIGLWSLGTIALRVVLVWLYQISGQSVFAAAVAHALCNLVWMLIPVYGSQYDAAADALATALLALAVLALTPGQTRVDSPCR